MVNYVMENCNDDGTIISFVPKRFRTKDMLKKAKVVYENIKYNHINLFKTCAIDEIFNELSDDIIIDETYEKLCSYCNKGRVLVSKKGTRNEFYEKCKKCNGNGKISWIANLINPL